MGISAVVPDGIPKDRLLRLIQSLEWQIEQDILTGDEKSKAIHTDALKTLQKAYEEAVGREVK